MDKNEFIKEHNIKDAKPLDPSLSVIPAEGFAEAICIFINEKFRGVATAKTTATSYGGILVSAEYTAYFFKLLLAEIYGRTFLDINISSDKDKLIIYIEYEGLLPLEDCQMRNLIRTARNAGMKINLYENKIKLSLSFSEAAIRCVYAVSVNDGRRITLSKFGELFYCGREYQSEERIPAIPLPPKKRAVRKKK